MSNHKNFRHNTLCTKKSSFKPKSVSLSLKVVMLLFAAICMVTFSVTADVVSVSNVGNPERANSEKVIIEVDGLPVSAF